jgi:hypothetical protein
MWPRRSRWVAEASDVLLLRKRRTRHVERPSCVNTAASDPAARSGPADSRRSARTRRGSPRSWWSARCHAEHGAIRGSSPGLLREESGGTLQDIDVLAQPAVLPPQRRELVFLGRGQPSVRLPASRSACFSHSRTAVSSDRSPSRSDRPTNEEFRRAAGARRAGATRRSRP